MLNALWTGSLILSSFNAGCSCSRRGLYPELNLLGFNFTRSWLQPVEIYTQKKTTASCDCHLKIPELSSAWEILPADGAVLAFFYVVASSQIYPQQLV